MLVVVFQTPAEKARGLQWRPVIEPNALFVFPEVGPGDVFHSQNVPEPFDIAFLDAGGRVLKRTLVKPPDGLVEAPEGTASALEAKAGRMEGWGMMEGAYTSFSLLAFRTRA